MAKNLIYPSNDRVMVTAAAVRTSGQAVRENGWNGVAEVNAAVGDQYVVVVQGVAEYVLSGVTQGALVYIDASMALTLTATGNTLFGKAITASASGTNKVRISIMNLI